MYQKKRCINQMKTEFRALSANESLARSMVCAFISQLSPTVGELSDLRCAVSEAVTNAIVHAYPTPGRHDTVCVQVWLYDDRSVKLVIRDKGIGITDVARAMEPMFTTDTTGERSGMGFAIMNCFTDQLKVKSVVGRGTTVEMRRRFERVENGACSDEGQRVS